MGKRLKWMATYYDANNNVICTEFFDDRLEQEARREAEGLMPSGCEDWSLSPQKTIYRTVIRFEILSGEPIPPTLTMGEIEQECDEGSYSGRFLEKEAENEPLVGVDAVTAIKAQGSDPEFFAMDAAGFDLE